MKDAVGDAAGAVTTRSNVALLLQRLGRRPEAVELYRRTLLDAERLGLAREIPRLACNLADALVHSGELDEARPLFERSLAAAREAGLPRTRWPRSGGFRTSRARGALLRVFGREWYSSRRMTEIQNRIEQLRNRVRQAQESL